MKKNKRDFKLATVIIILIGFIVNRACGLFTTTLNLPFYLDTIGTIFVAVVAGPLAGAITGVITHINFGFVSPYFNPYWPIPLLIGLVAGFFAHAGWFKHWWKVVIVGIIIAFIAATTSTLITIKVFGEITLNPSYFFVEELVDKIVTVLIVFVVMRFIPKSILSLVPRPENIRSEEKRNKTA